MKTICFELEDSVYEELSAMLTTLGLTEQVFYEFLTQTALKEKTFSLMHYQMRLQTVPAS